MSVDDLFEPVRRIGLGLGGVEAATKYDGSPMLTANGAFVAGMAMHASAEPGSIVVRCTLDDRALLLEDAPEIYYVTDYYERHPVVLVRLSSVSEDALRDLLSVSLRMALEKRARRRR